MAEPETTGTTAPAQEGAAQSSGTPEAAAADGNAAEPTAQERAELEALRRQKDQWLAEKDNSERIRRENEELRRQWEQTSRAYPPPTGYGIDPQQQQIVQDFADLQERDPAAVRVMAAMVKATQEQLQRQEAQVRYQRELDGVPSNYRGEVERVCRERNLWPSVALAVVREAEYTKKERDLAESARRIQEQEERLKRGVVKTTAEPAVSAPSGSHISGSQYDEIIARAEKGDREARKKLDDVEKGRLIVDL